jgi:hypothetical protein
VVTNWSLLHSLMPRHHSEYSSSEFSSIKNLVGEALPALVGTLLTTTGSCTAGFGLMFVTVLISLGCCLVLHPQAYRPPSQSPSSTGGRRPISHDSEVTECTTCPCRGYRTFPPASRRRFS